MCRFAYNNCVRHINLPSEIFLDSSMVEHSAVNRRVVGSSPTRGVLYCESVWYENLRCVLYGKSSVILGSLVKRLRHRPFTAVTWVQIP